MIASDLANLADTAELRARMERPLGPAELHALAATLRSLADRAAILESLPIPRAHRFRVIPGGNGDDAA
jgi:hypothetical protein